jgi:3-oxoacyl-[acyl-carrier-protein] synthase II
MLYDTSLLFSTHGHKKVSPHFVPLVLPNLAAGHLSQLHSLQGPISTPSTACTTGLHAIGDAARLVALNDADIMLAGATEACIHPLALAGFSQAKSLSTHFNDSPSQASRPFDKARDGFVLSEGAGVMILEALDHATARKAHIYAEIAGYGMSADAYHPTAPEPSGRGAEAAMRKAMLKANVTPDEVGYVNAHATGTVVGDRAENKAIQRVFGAPTNSKDRVSVSSFKGAVGHLLGAAGAVEAIWTVMALSNDSIPPTRNLDELDEDWGFEHVREKPRERNLDIALTNSFGFGGTNASLCIKKYKP